MKRKLRIMHFEIFAADVEIGGREITVHFNIPCSAASKEESLLVCAKIVMALNAQMSCVDSNYRVAVVDLQGAIQTINKGE